MKTMKLTLLLFLIGGMIVCINGCEKNYSEPQTCFQCQWDSINYEKQDIDHINEVVCTESYETVFRDIDRKYPNRFNTNKKCKLQGQY